MNLNKSNYLKIILFIIPVFLFSNCGIYSLSGVNIPNDVKSISILYFPNQAPQVAPTLSQVFTEKLKDKFQSETKLYLKDQEGDYQIDGIITDYNIRPVGISGNTAATENRLTMSAKVNFTCPNHPKFNFTKTYTNFVNFPASTDYSAIESQLITDVTTMMVQDIFNDIALKW
ncbi:MAG: LptE family protein [Bacteroidetes bacterium]|nr:LptE family protein [Bacteroidota bacterium]